MVLSSLVTDDDVQLQFLSYYKQLLPGSFYRTFPGLVVVTVTASLSALSSGVIILIIYKSRKSLTSIVYHRIMFFMSISDVIASIAIALTTLAVPKDMIYTTNIFPKSWPIYGTVATCSAQGFSLMTFTFLTYSCDFILCIYYLCSIKFGMSDRTFSLRREWAFFVLAILVVLPSAIRNLVQGNYNPDPNRARCKRIPYPYDCHGDGCLWGEEVKKGILVIWIFLAVFMFVGTILCLGLAVVLHVYRKDRASIEEKRATKARISTAIISAPADLDPADGFSKFDASIASSDEQEEEAEVTSTEHPTYTGAYNQSAQRYEDTKLIMKQACSYVCVWFVMLTLTLLAGSKFANNVYFGVVDAIIRPSHGTFNMIIFINHKYFNLRKISCCEILGKIFRGESDEAEIIVDTLRPVILHDVAVRNEERLLGLHAMDEESEGTSSINRLPSIPRQSRTDNFQNDEGNQGAIGPKLFEERASE